jgi:hypothetical protein
MSKSMKRRPPLIWEWASAPVDRSVIAAVEAAWGIRFPEDYVECARENHGGHPTNRKCFDFRGRKGAVFSDLLSFVAEGEKTTIVEMYNCVKDRLPAGVFPFAGDPFGNLLCFDYRKTPEQPTIAFWNHEVAFDDPERAVRYVCDTFTQLLNKLYNPEET